MKKEILKNWENITVPVETVLSKIEPGMTIFLSSGVAEPRTLVKNLIHSDRGNLSDLELIQAFSIGEAISVKEIVSRKYRLKTFFQGWIADEAISAGNVDLIPAFFSQIPQLIGSGQVSVDAAFIQITPPNDAGYSSFGIAMDAARQAMQKASLVVGEINEHIPHTYGDTFVHISEFDYLVKSEDPPIYFDRWPKDDACNQIAEYLASIIDNESCLAYSIGPIFETLSQSLKNKRNLGIHTPFFTDALMELCESGAITNRSKAVFQGKSLTSYALGTPDLMDWLDNNPLVEFQSTEKVLNLMTMGQNPNFIVVVPSRKVDFSGKIALLSGRANVGASVGEVSNLAAGARMSRGGFTVFALPSRNLSGASNILADLANYEEQFTIDEMVDLVVTEYGVAHLHGRSIRERAQALIEIAHPDDRKQLVEQAKEKRILYQDQIFMEESNHLYQSSIAEQQTFKEGLTVRFRAIRPSDEDQMRRLFYRFSDESVYYRYFTHIKAMPHAKMQQYVNVDYGETLSIVGLIGPPGKGQLIAEARYVKYKDRPMADIAFVVDEKYNGKGIATYLYLLLIRLAKERGLQGFTANVLASNRSMMKVFEKEGKMKAKLEYGEYELEILFDESTKSR